MGSYRCSIEEIKEAIIDALDKLEGDIYFDDVEKALEKAHVEYPYYTR